MLSPGSLTEHKMYKILICALLFILPKTCHCEDSITDTTELVLAFMVHRHGDRTPVQNTMAYAVNTEEVLKKTLEYGYGQLTDAGKRRAYELGKFIRQRYGNYLSDQYNKSEIYIRSTDSTRTKMTVMTAMAAVFPAGEDNWSKDINWTPVPYTTVTPKYDTLLPSLNCPNAQMGYGINYYFSASNLTQYAPLMEEISDLLGQDLTQTPASLYLIYDMFASQMSLGVPLTPELEDLLPEIEEGAARAADILYGNSNYLNLFAGVLLQEFFDMADSVINGKDVPRIRVYSAHDANVFTFSAATKIDPLIGAPKYASLFSLELRRDIQTGQYVVVPVYLEEPGVDEVYLQMGGCTGFCSLEDFRDLTSDYVLNETEWRTLCGFSEDIDLDISSLG